LSIQNTKSILLNGSDGYVDFGNPTVVNDIGTGDFTIKANVRCKNEVVSANNHQPILVKSTFATGDWGFMLSGFFADHRLSFHFDGTTLTSNSGIIMNGDVWRSVGITRVGTTVKFYIGGVLTDTFTTSNFTLSNAKNLISGARIPFSVDRRFNGNIDELAMWSRALTDAEMLVLSGRSLSDGEILDPSLVAYWPFNNNALDASSNNINGTLVGGATYSDDIPFIDPDPIITINITEITGVTVPVKGATPVSSVIETDQYTGVIVWSPNNIVFNASTIYTASITLTPKEGYTLTGVPENFFTVFGATATNSSDSVLVLATFPATEPEPEPEPPTNPFEDINQLTVYNDLLVLDENYDLFGIIDRYESLLWVERYSEFGDFEIYTPATKEMIALLKEDYFIYKKDSNKLMIIEKVKVTTVSDEGDYLIVSGRSLESILSRRVITERTNITGSLQNGIQSLVNNCIISPTNLFRRIDNFIFVPSEDPYILSLTVDLDLFGENLYDIVHGLCDIHGLGISIVLTEDLYLEMRLYVGEDRSYDQDVNPYVRFSRSFDNLATSNYTMSIENYKNVGVGVVTINDVDIFSTVGDSAGLSRREIFIESSNATDTTTLEEECRMSLVGYNKTKEFDAEIDTSYMIKYNDEFFLGDIVQLSDPYGADERARITEVIFSIGVDGYTSHPKFKVLSGGD